MHIEKRVWDWTRPRFAKVKNFYFTYPFLSGYNDTSKAIFLASGYPACLGILFGLSG